MNLGLWMLILSGLSSMTFWYLLNRFQISNYDTIQGISFIYA